MSMDATLETFDIFDKIYALLEQMQSTAKVDLSIVDKFDVLIGQSKKFERFWTTNKRASIEDAFILFHASRNSRLVLEKAKARFLSAVKEHSNPSVIHDFVRVMPALCDLHGTLTTLQKKPISPEIRSLVSKRLRVMRGIAIDTSMLPSYKEEVKDLNLEELKKQFIHLAETVRGIFFEA
ncbi:hypothetical protein ES703_06287 [subsurface metagenome]